MQLPYGIAKPGKHGLGEVDGRVAFVNCLLQGLAQYALHDDDLLVIARVAFDHIGDVFETAPASLRVV